MWSIIFLVFDSVIVGGGPAGLLAAARLAEAGLDVLVLEEHTRVGDPTHCTGIVSLEMADVAKVPGSIVLNRLTRAAMVAPGGARCRVTWDGVGQEQILVIDRGAFDQSLAEEALAAGARLRTNARVDALAVGSSSVQVRVGRETLSARACLLACGVSYRFQRQLGLGLPGRVIHTAQLEVDAAPSNTVELHFGRKIAPDGFLWTVPVVREGRPRLKIGVMANGDAETHLRRFVVRPAVRARLRGELGAPIRRLLPLRPIAKTYADRVLVVGDAGGFTKPTTGGGIFYSLLTAALAAETFIEGFGAGRLDEAFLERYERAWQARLGQELRVGDWFRELATTCTDAEIDTIIRALASDDVQGVIRRTARFNWHRDVILALVRQRGIASLLFRALFR